jgi:uncharacterized protein
MRAYAWFLAALIGAGLIGATLAYPAYELTSRFQPWAFHRVASRVAMLILAAELLWLCRHLGIRSKREFGYGLPWRRFVRVALLWGAAGILTAAVGAVFLMGTELRVPVPPSAFVLAGAARWPHLLLLGASSGLAVALIEETVFRGALHTAVERASGSLTAALLTAPLFAILHFFAKASVPPELVHWGSGFDLLARSFAPLGHPLWVLDSFASWLAVGLVLSLARILTGNIAVPIGLHAGWVVVLRILQESTARGSSGDYAGWVGRFDGLLGYWLLPWAAGIALMLWLTRALWTPYASGVNGADGGAGVSGASRSKRSMGSSSSR